MERALQQSRDRHLLAAIQRHPFLWNKQLPQYANRTQNRPTWNQIAAEIGLTADECRRRWKNLRTSYWKYLLARATGNTRRNFELAQSMEFLKPHIEVMGKQPVKREAEDDRQPDWETDEDSRSSAKEQEPLEARAQVQQRTGTECKHLAVDAENADALFLLSMLPEMGRMSEERKRIFKIQVMELCNKCL